MNTNKTATKLDKAEKGKQESMSADEKVKMRLEEQRKLNESGSCCGACGG